METPDSSQNEEKVALKLSHHLVELRDALMSLSLALNDLLFEARTSEEGSNELPRHELIEGKKPK
jgi:hypothetical protein